VFGIPVPQTPRYNRNNVKEMDTATEGAPHRIAVRSTLCKVHSTSYGDVTTTNRT